MTIQKTVVFLLTGFLSIASICIAQSAVHPEFEVASVKLAPQLKPGERYAANLGTARNGTVTLDE